MQTYEAQNLESFRVAGINYQKGDTAVRGMFAINQEQYGKMLETAAAYGVTDFFVLSTCNRTEIYGFAPSDAMMTAFLCSVSAGDVSTFEGIAYHKTGNEAMQHLYRVACGLDSQILGDYEIMGQIKTAVKFAKNGGYIHSLMERLLNSVMQSCKAVKTKTALSSGTVSVSFAAIQYIKEYAEQAGVEPKQLKIALIGTGKIGRVTCRNIIDYLHTRNMTLINRTEATAAELAKEHGLRHAPIETLAAEVAAADIVLVSTNANEPVIVREHLNGGARKLVIDISVPCNVAEDARSLPGIRFVDVDMLSKIKDETLQKRQEEVPAAMSIIEEHLAEFAEWYAMRRHVPVLKEVKSKLLALPLHMRNGEACETKHEEKVQKAINNLATSMRRNDTPGCLYIQAIKEFIA